MDMKNDSMFDGKTIKSTHVGYSGGMVKGVVITFTDETYLSINSYDDGELYLMSDMILQKKED